MNCRNQACGKRRAEDGHESTNNMPVVETTIVESKGVMKHANDLQAGHKSPTGNLCNWGRSVEGRRQQTALHAKREYNTFTVPNRVWMKMIRIPPVHNAYLWKFTFTKDYQLQLDSVRTRSGSQKNTDPYETWNVYQYIP